MRIKAADTVVFLDVHRMVSLWGAIKRRFSNLGKTRPDMGTGCEEKLNWEFVLFLKYIWRFDKTNKTSIMQLLKKYGEVRRIVILRSREEAERYLSSLPYVDRDEHPLGGEDHVSKR